jgi:hypothetical protein
MKLPVQVALGAGLLILSGIALGYGLLEQAEVRVCASAVCSGVALYPLGRSLYLWGALYYAAAGVTVFLGCRKHAAGLLVAGAAIHTSLVAYGWISTKTFLFCPTCINLWLALVCFVAAFLLAPGGFEKRRKSAFAGVLLVGLAAWLLVFSAGVQPETQAAAAGNLLALHGAAEGQEDVNQSAELAVETLDGEEVLLDLRERPALLFAWWCSHCTTALHAAAGLPERERPYLVAAYLRGGDTPKIKQKLAEAGLAGPYYLLPGEPSVGEVPALLWWEGGGGLRVVRGGDAVQELKAWDR